MFHCLHQVDNELKHPSSGHVIRRCLGQIFVVSTSDTYICRSTVSSTRPLDLPGLLPLPCTPKDESIAIRQHFGNIIKKQSNNDKILAKWAFNQSSKLWV